MIEDKSIEIISLKDLKIISTRRIRLPDNWRINRLALLIILISLIFQIGIPIRIMIYLVIGLRVLEETAALITYYILILIGSLLTGFVAFALVLKKERSDLEKKTILYSSEAGGLIIMYMFYSLCSCGEIEELYVVELRRSFAYYLDNSQALICFINVHLITFWLLGIFLAYLLGGFLFVKVRDSKNSFLELVRFDELMPKKILGYFLFLSSFGVGYDYYINLGFIYFWRSPEAILSSTSIFFGFLLGYGVGLVVLSLVWGFDKENINEIQEIRELLFILISGFYLFVVTVGVYLNFYSLVTPRYFCFYCEEYESILDYLHLWGPFFHAGLKALFFFFGGYYVLKLMERMLTQRMIGS